MILPQAHTFKLALEILEKSRKDDPTGWGIKRRYVCYALCKVTHCQPPKPALPVGEYWRATGYITSILFPYDTLEDWLVCRHGFRAAYWETAAVNDHRIEWVKRIIKELS